MGLNGFVVKNTMVLKDVAKKAPKHAAERISSALQLKQHNPLHREMLSRYESAAGHLASGATTANTNDDGTPCR